jgi:hypothetical protein
MIISDDERYFAPKIALTASDSSQVNYRTQPRSVHCKVKQAQNPACIKYRGIIIAQKKKKKKKKLAANTFYRNGNPKIAPGRKNKKYFKCLKPQPA